MYSISLPLVRYLARLSKICFDNLQHKAGNRKCRHRKKHETESAGNGKYREQNVQGLENLRNGHPRLTAYNHAQSCCLMEFA